MATTVDIKEPRGLGYYIGWLFARHPLATFGTILISLLAFTQCSGFAEKAKKDHDEAERQVTLARSAEQRKAQAQQREKAKQGCLARASQIEAEAVTLMKANDPEAAMASLAPCAEWVDSPGIQ